MLKYNPITGKWEKDKTSAFNSSLNNGLTSGINRDPVRFDPLSPSSYGKQIMNQLNPSPHKPLFPFRIGPLG